MERLSGSVCGVRIVHVVELARARATNICSIDRIAQCTGI